MTPSLKQLSAIGAIAGVLAFGGIAAAAGTEESTTPTTPTEVVVDDASGLVTQTGDGTDDETDDTDTTIDDDTVDDGTVEGTPEPGARPDGQGRQGRGGDGENCGDKSGSDGAGVESSDSSMTAPTSDAADQRRRRSDGPHVGRLTESALVAPPRRTR
jgi:hypothetical protein